MNPDQSADVVLMHGPLYHLTEIEDRMRALSEARRVLKPGGVLLAFAITRYAGAVYGITKGLIYDADYRRMIRTEVETGRRTNPPDGIHTLPNAYFHLPEELGSELEAAGFRCEALLGVVGPAWLVPEIDVAWEEPCQASVYDRDGPFAGERACAWPAFTCRRKKAGMTTFRSSGQQEDVL